LILTVNDNFHATLKFLESRLRLLPRATSVEQENSIAKGFFFEGARWRKSGLRTGRRAPSSDNAKH
jgi:hypothetical protein